MTAIVDCPVCARKTEFSPANRWRPFCSERCKMIDLGQWASGGYVIPGDTPDPEQPSDTPAAAPGDRN
jgi:endogenous inhibitor of DNA gyrase (YacG/DUF329 family)